LIFWTIVLTLVGRAAHVFPLSFIMNCFRSKQHQITFSMQLIMWFAGLRGKQREIASCYESLSFTLC
jgi:solute carrier family 9 (sodium/hydrogen exchanger), member 8